MAWPDKIVPPIFLGCWGKGGGGFHDCKSKQKPLGEIFKIFGKGEEPCMGGLNILWGDLVTP